MGPRINVVSGGSTFSGCLHIRLAHQLCCMEQGLETPALLHRSPGPYVFVCREAAYSGRRYISNA